ncbi:calcium-binding protein SPEC 2C [Strongylocentrotus purpuratus]|uniref:Calcium-binding protein SPEC 2C n=1 Tax=Strongylocentrotus purpuratus TaxID=7668 RepID=SPE2C_STRPU|nr:calcium-binding protein SPEC 2C [Strongylocentrotus purpuratus]P04111.2 RecName: Full=Calcium-binding protein SPEC 2C [Strongylocentrotus purpuratus]CAA31260.2 spec2c protein [Strongylocentrotus purpuratus]|eukprot:NP_999769.1 calcium-binding protein SPEC 2C [Strongylocentrotus purpuratus]
MAVQLFFTEEQRKVFKSSFKSIDADGDGKITPEELKAAFKSIEIELTQEKIDEMMSMVDKDGSRPVDFSEILMKKAEQMRGKGAQYFKAFDALDTDKSGSLSPEELRTALSACTDPPMTKEEIDAIIKKADGNNDGEIRRAEFVRMIQSSY